jgi:hypothetical protein
MLIDKEDKHLIENRNWHVKTFGDNSYYLSYTGGKETRLHRLILGVTDPRQHIDHINGNGLDNRRCNLRLCNNAQNSMNRKKVLAKSGYKGVYPVGNKWQASIWLNKKKKHLGLFGDKKKAAKAYDLAAEKYFGEFASLNFAE